jgi:hypothetical protein
MKRLLMGFVVAAMLTVPTATFSLAAGPAPPAPPGALQLTPAQQQQFASLSPTEMAAESAGVEAALHSTGNTPRIVTRELTPAQAQAAGIVEKAGDPCWLATAYSYYQGVLGTSGVVQFTYCASGSTITYVTSNPPSYCCRRSGKCGH